MTDRMIKQESSIPVQSRVSLISLAELAKYWESTEYEMRSMSQLISWSLDLLRDILKANEMIKVEEEFEYIVEARDYLVGRGLWQQKVAKRAFTKIGNAVRFQGFRDLGENPETRDEMSKIGHNLMHNKHSVSPYRDRASARQKMVAEMTKVYHELEAIEEEEPEKLSQEEVRAKYFKKQAEMKESKGEITSGPVVKEDMNDEEWEAKKSEIAKRDKERIELEQTAVIDESNIVSGK